MISGEARAALEAILEERVRFAVPMARHTSLRVGGPVDALATPADRPELEGLLRVCALHDLPHVVVGGGFNVLVRDGGLPGVAILLKRFRRLEERPGGLVRAEAGVSHASLTRFCADRGLAGLEFGAGIPGTIGGWVTMNAGIGSRELVDVVREIEVVSPSGRHRRHLDQKRLHFRYRSLRGLAPGSVIVSALLEVRPAEPGAVQAEVNRLLAARAESQPLTVPSCGSVFRNPPEDHAGRLIEAAGLKGAREGGAEISTLHANFIATRPGARAVDVLALIRRARNEVERTSGVRLETEVRILGLDVVEQESAG